MKKLLALVLAAVMLFSVTAFAETAEEEVLEAIAVDASENLVPDVDMNEVLDFSLSMDAIPSGYSMEVFETDNVIFAEFKKDNDENATIFEAAVAYSEMFAGYTLKYDELTAGQWMEMQELIGENYNEADYTVAQTTHGTDVIVINENVGLSDTLEVMTIYDGYIISIVALKLDGELTEEDTELALQLMSDMWVVKK